MHPAVFPITKSDKDSVPLSKLLEYTITSARTDKQRENCVTNYITHTVKIKKNFQNIPTIYTVYILVNRRNPWNRSLNFSLAEILFFYRLAFNQVMLNLFSNP